MNPTRVAAVILAAGGSTRLGQPKQLLRFQGESFVARAAAIAGNVGCSPVVVVTGANSSDVEAALKLVPFARRVFNPDWGSGMGSSIGVGVSVLLSDAFLLKAVLLLVCDQPLISETLLLRLCATYRDTGKKVVASEYGGIWGVPCLFDREILPELTTLRATGGAKSVIERYRKAGDAISIPFPGGAFDVDTPADWELLHDSEKTIEAS